MSSCCAPVAGKLQPAPSPERQLLPRGHIYGLPIGPSDGEAVNPTPLPAIHPGKCWNSTNLLEADLSFPMCLPTPDSQLPEAMAYSKLLNQGPSNLGAGAFPKR
jgi:hypothetical protein